MNICSKYTLEYGSALLLNLSLRADGRLACEKSQQDVLKVSTLINSSFVLFLT